MRAALPVLALALLGPTPALATGTIDCSIADANHSRKPVPWTPHREPGI